ELAQRDDWIVRLTEKHVAELEAAAAPIVAQRDARALAFVTAADFPLPTLCHLLATCRDELLHGRGFVLLRGLPVDRYAPLGRAARSRALPERERPPARSRLRSRPLRRRPQRPHLSDPRTPELPHRLVRRGWPALHPRSEARRRLAPRERALHLQRAPAHPPGP